MYGCTDTDAENYNPDAVRDDNSCEYIKGCTTKGADNYNPDAVEDDNSCEYGPIDLKPLLPFTLPVTGAVGVALAKYGSDRKNNKNKRYCIKCGNIIRNTQLFCTKCGRKIE